MSSSSPSLYPTESSSEYYTDLSLFLSFLLLTFLSLKRMIWSYTQGGVETTVVTAFYTLICTTATARAVWFGIPNLWMEESYVPRPVEAFKKSDAWMGTVLSEILLSLGSLSLFSIFILILVYWSDILKKYFYPGIRRNKPMSTFLTMVCGLFTFQA